jgi:hypothetical protein
VDIMAVSGEVLSWNEVVRFSGFFLDFCFYFWQDDSSSLSWNGLGVSYLARQETRNGKATGAHRKKE